MKKEGMLPTRDGSMPIIRDSLPVVVKIKGQVFELSQHEALKIASEILITLEVMNE